MATNKQKKGEFGEKMVIKHCNCPKCKKIKTLKRLPNNFKCVDIICEFCGYLAQVKTKEYKNIEKIPPKIPGSAWGPHSERMDAGIYFPLFIVLLNYKGKSKEFSIFYLSADIQTPNMFIERKPLSKDAVRSGWVGFEYNLKDIPVGSFLRLK